MNFLDIRTVVFLGGVISLVCLLVLLLLWRQNRDRFAGTGFWVADLAFQALALILIVLRGSIPDWLSFVLANTLVVAGAILGLMGLERFVGKRGTQRHNYLLLALFVCFHSYFTFLQPALSVRNLILSLALFIICFQCSWLLLHRVGPEVRAWTRGVGLVFAGYCLVSLLRIGEFFTAGHLSNDYFQSRFFDTLVMTAYLTLFVLLTYSLVLMVNQRLLNEISTQEEKFSKAFRSSPYAIVLTRLSDGTVLEANDAFCAISGYSPAEVLGKSTFDLHLWTRPEDRAQIVADLARTGRIQGRELPFLMRSGDVATGLLSAEIIVINGASCILAIVADITARKRAEKEREQLIAELQDALSRIRTLSGLLPICACCKKIRNDEGYWEQIEGYIQDRSDAEFSHGICPDCARNLYPNYFQGKDAGEEDRVTPGSRP
jgi:PAS domain S-box-containing protein